MGEKPAAGFKALSDMTMAAHAKALAAMFVAQAALRCVPDRAAAAVELDRVIAELQKATGLLPGMAATVEKHLRSARADLLGEVPGQESSSPWELLKKGPS